LATVVVLHHLLNVFLAEDQLFARRETKNPTMQESAQIFCKESKHEHSCGDFDANMSTELSEHEAVSILYDVLGNCYPWIGIKYPELMKEFGEIFRTEPFCGESGCGEHEQRKMVITVRR
jgi:hypothetical protein